MKKVSEWSLQEYLINVLNVDPSVLVCTTSDFYADPDNYVNFLETTKIVLQLSRIHKKLTVSKSREFQRDYIEIVDDIIKLILSRDKFSNILTFGYHYHDDTVPSIISDLYNSSVSFNVNHLKGKLWQSLYTKIGIDLFYDLVMNTNCFIQLPGGSYLQLFGSLGTFSEQESNRKSASYIVQMSKLLYKMPNDYKYIFPKHFNELVCKIDTRRQTSSTKLFSQLQNLCKEIIRNHLKCPYKPVYIETIEKNSKITRESAKDNFQLATELSLVIKYACIIIGKIFPLRVWGTSKNKSIILLNVAAYLQLGRNESMEIHIIANKLQSSKIEWLGKSPKATSLQDSQNRTIILVRFLHWFYSEFLNNLVGSFWYVTETSRGSGMELLFYPHLIWSEITTPWMTNYELNNLKDVTSTCNIHGHNVNGKGFYHGKLRLIPKPNDFRLLCIPIKSKSSQFNHHMYNYIYPVRSLLREKLNKKSKTSKYPSCHSTVEVIIKLKEFLKLSNRKGEKLFLIKFDMKQCYDMLNKRQTVIIVEKLLQDNTSNKNTTYYFREMGKAKKLVSQFRSQFYEIKNKSSIDKLSPFNHSSQNKENSTILDRSRTKVLTEKEVLQVVESQIFLSAIIRLDQATLRISCYGRQRGVFQGFPLLGTLSEIVYCDLVETYFNFLPKENSVILRLADDFLVLSTDRIQCEKVRNLILKGFDETHGAIVNTDKTVTINLDPNSSSSEVLFTGFKFNPNTLEIDRTDPEIKINSKNLMSFKSIFSYLLLYYKRKLRDSVFDDVDSFCTILNNVEVIIRGTLYSLTANLKYIMKLKEGYLDEDAAAEFFLNLIFITLNELNCNMEITESLILIFKECFQQILLECTYLKDVLEVLIAVMNLNID